MSDLRELYQEVIFDHYRRPRNFGPLGSGNRRAEGYNPLCGDKVTIHLDVEGGVIRDASFEGEGCAISTASASLMTESLKGLRAEEALALMQAFQRRVTGAGDDAIPSDAAGDDANGATRTRAAAPALGKLEVLAGVREFPARIKCATLAWHTLQAALENQPQPVSTE